MTAQQTMWCVATQTLSAKWHDVTAICHWPAAASSSWAIHWKWLLLLLSLHTNTNSHFRQAYTRASPRTNDDDDDAVAVAAESTSAIRHMTPEKKKKKKRKTSSLVQKVRRRQWEQLMYDPNGKAAQISCQSVQCINPVPVHSFTSSIDLICPQIQKEKLYRCEASAAPNKHHFLLFSFKKE